MTRLTRVPLAALALICLAAVPALAAPTSSSAPSIEGTPAWNSELTCQPGSWSADAVGFDYVWAHSGNGPVIATGQTWRVRDAQGYRVVCRVTARDSAGATTTATSPAVVIGDGIMTIDTSFKRKQKRKKMVVKGRVTPQEAHEDSATQRSGITLYRVKGKGRYVQLTFNQTVKPDGTFKLKFKGKKGKRRYQLQVSPANDRYGVATKQIVIKGR